MIGERLAETGGGLVAETRYHVRFDAPGDPSQPNRKVPRISRREPLWALFWSEELPDRIPSRYLLSGEGGFCASTLRPVGGTENRNDPCEY